jgi:hypothetical protein
VTSRFLARFCTETGIAIARQVMELRGMSTPIIDRMLNAIRTLWNMKP